MKRRTMLILLLLIALVLPTHGFAERGHVIPGDYDRDGRSDIVVTRSIGGLINWFIRFADGTEAAIPFGLTGDTLVAGDYDGDGDFEPGVVRPFAGTLFWFNRRDDGEAQATQWGLTGDTPLTGFFGGNGESERVVVRSTGGQLTWFILRDGLTSGIPFGLTGDTPYTADINADGIDELIVARTEGGAINWYIGNTAGAVVQAVSWGLAGDTTLPPSDCNGDGIADLVVTRNLGGFKFAFIQYLGIGLTDQVLFGLQGDTPYIGNFTQGSLAELAMLRESAFISTHFVRFATDGFVASVDFGLVGDTLVQPEGRAPAESSALPTCIPTPGTASNFNDGAGRGALWKPVSEGVANAAPVVLLPISYCGATLTVLASDGTPVSGVQRTKCGGNGNRAHFWIARTASQLAPFQPLTVKVERSAGVECRVVPSARNRFD